MAQIYAATINPGLEQALLSEIRSLGGKKASLFEGGVSFRATHKVAYRVLQHTRCANQLRLRVDEFRARDIHEFYRKLKRFEWDRLLVDRGAVSFRVATRTSRLNDSREIIGTACDAMESQGYHVKDDGVEILLRFEDDRCDISLDASGRELFKRGYRTEHAGAPIRESLAAAVLRLVEPEVLTDPCCGSGTFVIEHAMATLGLLPRPDRQYTIEQWANFDAALFAEQRLWRPKTSFEPRPISRGFDVDPSAIEVARANAVRAGVEDVVTFAVKDVNDIEDDAQIVCNPPYDQRVQDAGLSVIETLDKHPFATFIVPGAWKGNGRVLARFQNGGLPVKLVRSSAFED